MQKHPMQTTNALLCSPTYLSLVGVLVGLPVPAAPAWRVLRSSSLSSSWWSACRSSSHTPRGTQSCYRCPGNRRRRSARRYRRKHCRSSATPSRSRGQHPGSESRCLRTGGGGVVGCGLLESLQHLRSLMEFDILATSKVGSFKPLQHLRSYHSRYRLVTVGTQDDFVVLPHQAASITIQ